MRIERVLIASVCAALAAIERMLLEQSMGAIVVSSIVSAVGYFACSGAAKSVTSLIKVAVLLLGVLLAFDGLEFLITWFVDGSATVASANWLTSVIVAWLLLYKFPRISRWAGLAREGEDAANG